MHAHIAFLHQTLVVKFWSILSGTGCLYETATRVQEEIHNSVIMDYFPISKALQGFFCGGRTKFCRPRRGTASVLLLPKEGANTAAGGQAAEHSNQSPLLSSLHRSSRLSSRFFYLFFNTYPPPGFAGKQTHSICLPFLRPRSERQTRTWCLVPGSPPAPAGWTPACNPTLLIPPFRDNERCTAWR